MKLIFPKSVDQFIKDYGVPDSKAFKCWLAYRNHDDKEEITNSLMEDEWILMEAFEGRKLTCTHSKLKKDTVTCSDCGFILF